ncbi:hypothetical protein [Anabaena sp. UHCC 0399]|uniref:hypothetical protein n=1 Tax=Anabaena sp. UHCC 0399 TaxID=3110238 RepID=UPI002B214E0B|nr:hypothetical protein [Anabaena sp. UHCC 0399]MEA5564234.1 hypothetical protein [Anabaena sp. UHCC 0399]
MKKQSLPLNLGLVLILLTCLVSAPLRVNAGSANVVGVSDDSASSSGDNLSPATEPPLEAVPGTNVEINSGDSEVNISTSPEIQNNVNEAANEILQQAEDANSSVAVSSVGVDGTVLSNAGSSNSVFAIIVVILQGGADAENSVNQLQSSLGNLGVSPSAIQRLVNALRGMISQSSASTSGVDMGSLKPAHLVAGVKELRTEVAQNVAKPSVDLNKLNAAITAYNNIVMESSPEVVQKLAKDPQFLEIGKVLKQLRAALNKR